MAAILEIPAPTTPSRIKRLGLLAVLLAAGAAFAFAVDMPIARWSESPHALGDFGKAVKLAEVFAHGSGVLLILLAALAIDPRHWRIVPRLALGAYGAGIVANLLKVTLGRTRPNVFDANQGVWDSFLGVFAWQEATSLGEAFSRDVQSFPSGHTATAAGLACALARLYPQGTWFFVAMTLLAGFQRIEANAHYLSDVLAGAAVGVLMNLALELPRLRRPLERLEGR
jgi:membrane-associated phospholipid phosphatase